MATNSAENQLSSSNSSHSSHSSTSSSLSSAEISALAFGDRELVRRIKASNILLVGAGGIGCEVIKGLLLAGFERVTILDLDTIDVSNLNRQFLYNKSHVGESKAKIAAAVSVERFAHRDPRTGRPLSTVTPIHDSILSLEYNRQFYRRFTFVINALDNNTTRVHVNRLCLAADVPLIESASASYNGNVRLIRRGVTQCFECIPPRKDENTYASCTIRNTPSLPIHCVVWAKHLFAQLFGEPDEEDISPDVTDEAMNLGDAQKAKNEEEEDSNGVAAGAEDENNEDNNNHNDSNKQATTRSQSTRRYVESTNYDAKALFDKIFYKDILYLKKMENLWKNRREPRELAYDRVASGEDCFEEEDISTSTTAAAAAAETVSNGGGKMMENKNNMAAQNSNSVLRDQTLWTMSQCFGVFRSSLAELAARLRVPINESSSSSSSSSASSSAASNRILEWDKDDDVAVDFVASVANFRSHCFHISRKSKFEIKSLAGNIIPAISSTNTIVGGYITLQAIRLLASLLPENIYRNNPDDQPDGENSAAKIDAEKAEAEARAIRTNCFSAYITNKNYNRISKLTTEPLLQPVGDCLACSAEVKEIIVALPLRKTTLGDFIEHVVKKKLRTIAPDINVFGLNKMLWTAEDDDDDEESNSIRRKLLSDYAFMRDGVCLLLQDLEQNFEVRLSLRDMEFDPEDNDGEFFKILNQHELEGVIREAAEAKNGDTATTNENGDKVDLSAAVASTSSSSSSSAIETVVDIDDDEPECVYDQGDDQMVAPSVAAAAEPNDDDFEMIEMSELDEIEIEIETNMATGAKKKRPKIDPDDYEVEDEEEDDDDLVCIEPKKPMIGENEDQNGHSNHRRRNSNTPTNKRIRTN